MTQPTRPTPAAALAALATLDPAATPQLLVVAKKADDPPELAATRPTDRLAAALREIAVDCATDWAAREVIDYDPATTVADGQVMWAALPEVPLLAFPELTRDPADLPLFDPHAPYAAHLRLQAIRLPTPAGVATFYRELRPRQVLARSGKVTIIRRADRMDLLDEPALTIERGVDALAVADIVLFVDRGRFQRVFGFLDQIRQRAATTFDAVTHRLDIDGLAELRTAATSQPAMLAKMSSIERKLADFPDYRRALTMPSLLAFVRAHPETEVEVSGPEADARLVFRADAQHRFKILKLLDDDFLQSQLTTMRYEANSKGPPL
jgi:hypothetical protein